jgi:hypothetical protein
MLTRAQFTALAEKAQADPRPLIETAFWIKTKMETGQSPVQLFRFQKGQVAIHDALQQQRAEGRPGRVIVLKCRQSGGSTYGSGRVAATALVRPYSRSMQIAQAEATVLNLFQMIQFMYESLDPEMRPHFGTDRRDELSLRNFPCTDGEVQLNSSIVVAMAGASEPWRGPTIQTAHISELAYQGARAAEVLGGTLQAVPKTPQSVVIVESTANGNGGIYADEWRRAVAGESDFVPVFIPWFHMEGYQHPVPPDFELTLEELEIKRAFGLSNEQIQWRRFALRTECRGSLDFFGQEYPSTPEEAFVTSGRPAFSRQILQEMAEAVRSAVPTEGVISEGGFTPMRGGPVKVYKKPVPGHDYTLGADPSAGIPPTPGSPGGDPSAAAVFDRDTGEFVATWHGFKDPIDFAHDCMWLGKWYNTAILAPECNGGWGLSMVGEMKLAQYERPYVWTRIDKIHRTVTDWYGWFTTYKSKQYLIDTTAHAITDREIVIYDPATILEMLMFEYYGDRNQAGGMGSADDRVMATLIAYRVHIESPLQSTGMPPKVKYESDAPVKDDRPAMPQGTMNREAWASVDEELARMKRGPRQLDEIVQPDPETLGPDDNPNALWDHPY